MNKLIAIISLLAFLGCASTSGMLGTRKLNVPAEFNQEIILLSSDNYEAHQATRSGYDIGDLQSFHSQHTFSMKAEEAFKEMFPKVTLKTPGEATLDLGNSGAAAIFEVNIIDLAHDVYLEADRYRAQVTIAAALKSPSGNIYWQKAFRGDGSVEVFDEYSVGLGPEEAVINGVHNALDQMQEAIIKDPQVRLYFQKYAEIQASKSGTEQTL